MREWVRESEYSEENRKHGHVSQPPSTRYTLQYSRDTSLTYDRKSRQ